MTCFSLAYLKGLRYVGDLRRRRGPGRLSAPSLTWIKENACSPR